MDNKSAIFVLLVIFIVGGKCQHCPDDWVFFHGSCYAFLNEVVPWTTAEAYCRLMHSQMVEIESQAENDFVAAQITSRFGAGSNRGAWLGINDLLREGYFVYNSNGAAITYSKWSPGAPNDSHAAENGEDCAWLWDTAGTWDDLWCEDFDRSTYRPMPVCEMESQGAIVG